MKYEIPEDDHWWFGSRTRALHSVMGPYVNKTANTRLLDVGCGAGNMIHHLSEYGQVKGLEIDERPVVVARERGYDVDQFDATQQMPFDPNTFDAITTLDVIEHNEDDMAILADSYRILKPGGHIIITVPAFMWLWSHNDDINAHVRRYTRPELRDKLAKTGFKVNRITYNNFFVFPLAASLLLLRRNAEAQPDLASHHLDEEEYQVEMEPASPPVNAVLTTVGKVEAGLMRMVNLPVGTSLIAIAEKPQ
ncbi:MAG: class I SAM-dependent methyltransferase [Chloroflexota bacterium]